jgi:hypothetical protein
MDFSGFVTIPTITLILNLLIFASNIFYNYRTFKSRRTNEREYQLNFKFYDSLVVSNLSHFSEYIGSLTNCLSSLLSDYSANNKLKTIKEIDKIHSDLKSKSYFAFRCYSKDLRSKIEVCTEDFYDESTKIISEIDMPTNDKGAIVDRFNKIKEDYIDQIYKMVKEVKPDHY